MNKNSPDQYIPKKVSDAGADVSLMQAEDNLPNYTKKDYLSAEKKDIYNALEEKNRS